MRRSLVISVITLLMTVAVGLAACTILKENREPEARNIALNDFGYDEVWTACYGTSDSVWVQDRASRGGYYVLGLRDDKEIFIFVPTQQDESTFEIEWPFAKSFREIIEHLNETVGEEICTKSEYGSVLLVDSDFDMHLPGIDPESLDVAFLIEYREYVIAQVGGELIVENYREKILTNVISKGLAIWLAP